MSPGAHSIDEVGRRWKLRRRQFALSSVGEPLICIAGPPLGWVNNSELLAETSKRRAARSAEHGR